MNDTMAWVGYAAAILAALAALLAAVTKAAHALGYEVPVLTRIADVLVALAGVVAARPLVAVRRARRAGGV